MAVTANAVELAKMNWKRKSSDEELNLVNKRFEKHKVSPVET